MNFRIGLIYFASTLLISILFFSTSYSQNLMKKPNERSNISLRNDIHQSASKFPIIINMFFIYQNYISPIDGDHRCSFYPSCSSYSLSAYKKHDPLTATFLTFDRLTRCGFDNGPHVIIDRHLVILDLLSFNNFWLK